MDDPVPDAVRRAMRSSVIAKQFAQIRPTVLALAVGGIALALSTWLSFQLGARMTVAASVCVTEIALLALIGSLASSILLSVIAVCCLDYFFASPLFYLRVDLARDFWALTAFFVTSSTVSCLVHRARQLEAIHREQAMLLELTHDSVTVRDISDVITYWNRGAETLFGWKKDEALGKMSRSLLRSRYPVAFDEIKRTVLEIGYWEGEVVHTAKNGSVLAAESRCSVLRNKHGLPVAILETGTDITERKRKEEALESVARATTIGELGASVAHELGQPLAAISAHSAAGIMWLNRDSPNIDEALSSLQLVAAESRRAAEIIRRLRALAKRTPPQVTRLAINDVVKDVIPLLQRELLNHQVTLKTKLDADLPTALGDQVQLAQVTINLAMNAIQAMDAVTDRPRELVIESRCGDAGDVIIAVRDSGTGIEAENAPRLFEPFFTTKPEGMGVGLSICQAIIQSHGGELRLRNNVEHGATVEFSVPTIAPRDATQQ
ncbi:Adaptive-response sensory-kinase SasA [Paraburkholderia ultramafica]|uniref:histidine kinase n=1 Tax=Paraburkholderia ultramafica TaxID=1544867 RepID=A0A6S7BQ07_9BURK|nr:PAS domain-containing sensor histidine kinase [Paraburkholderia ultramafica]CAB3809136.1 Adaptive-response sensory-kinase SasA [Paraburkholderia ultramafica]